MSERCWAEIGTWGDRSCPLLPAAVHCRNCEVFARNGRQLLDREPPDDYLRGWSAVLADTRKDKAEGQNVAMVVSLGDAYYALPAAVCREALEAHQIRRIPHRSNDFLLGLVGVRGELRVCVSLSALGLGDGAAGAGNQMVLLEKNGREWVVAVSGIHGIHRYGPEDIEPNPQTLAQSPNPYTIGLVRWRDRMLGVLDDELLLSTIARRLA
jgi:chemotaxis-related protein WspD